MSSLAWRGRLRHGAGRLLRRLRRSRVGAAVRRPAVTVVVPFYNVEEYIAECLESLVGQSFEDLELLLVDDGSPDGSRSIVDEYAARDHRIRVLTQPNAGLGAARNAGVRAARGRYLTFVDSDDIVPRDAIRALVDSARRSGSDVVVGSVERFNSRGRWTPLWVETVHDRARPGVTLADVPALLRNLYTWDKLFRADFWRAQDLWFRQGVAYEDQPIVSQLLARADSIDVLPDIVYHYRARDDYSSISQQTATVADLRQRIAAWEVSRQALSAELPPTLYDAWLATLVDAHFLWYLASPGTVDDEYWQEITTAVHDLVDEASPEVWRAAQPAGRVLVRLAQLGRRADCQEFVRQGGSTPEQWPATVTEDGVLLHLPFFGDPDLEDELFLLRPDQLRISHSVDRMRWVSSSAAGPADEDVCELAGWAYLRKVDLAVHDATVAVFLRNPRTGDQVEVPTGPLPGPISSIPLDDTDCDYSAGLFHAEIPVSALLAGGRDDEWGVWLRVAAAGFCVEQPVTRLRRSGSPGSVPAYRLPDGRGRITVRWQYQQPLRLQVDTGGHTGVDMELTPQGAVRGRLAGSAGQVTRVLATAGQAEAVAEWQGEAGGRFQLQLPALPRAPRVQRTWQLHAELIDGRRVPLCASHELTESDPVQVGGRSLVLGADRLGGLIVTEWSAGAVVDDVEVLPGGELRMTGRLFARHDPADTVTVHTTSLRLAAEGPAVLVAGHRFEATMPLTAPRFRFGDLPLPRGEHDIALRLETATGARRKIPVLCSAALADQLPVLVSTEAVEGRVVRGPENGVRLRLVRPVGDAVTKYAQRRLQAAPTATRLTRGVLMRAYFGEWATDNGLSIQAELQRRGSDLPVYWTVQDRSVPVPDGGIPIIANSREWYHLLGSAAYYIDNMYQPEFHHKPAGQVVVQTFHGYPFKAMGHPHWRQMQFSRARIEEYDRRAAEWDYLVSPARYATPLLTDAFAYDGQVLEIGYPPQRRPAVARGWGDP
ncbi:MAG: glycosyltransferase [Nocardioides sp.]